MALSTSIPFVFLGFAHYLCCESLKFYLKTKINHVFLPITEVSMNNLDI